MSAKAGRVGNEYYLPFPPSQFESKRLSDSCSPERQNLPPACAYKCKQQLYGCTYKDGHHAHAMAFDNVRIPVALFVDVKVEDVKTMVDRSTSFPWCPWTGHEILVFLLRLFDQGREFRPVVKEGLPPGAARGTTTNRHPRDAALLDTEWLERDAQWKIHEFLRMERRTEGEKVGSEERESEGEEGESHFWGLHPQPTQTKVGATIRHAKVKFERREHRKLLVT
jgi:hypothetical protein